MSEHTGEIAHGGDEPHEHDAAGCLDCECWAAPPSSRIPCTCPPAVRSDMRPSNVPTDAWQCANCDPWSLADRGQCYECGWMRGGPTPRLGGLLDMSTPPGLSRGVAMSGQSDERASESVYRALASVVQWDEDDHWLLREMANAVVTSPDLDVRVSSGQTTATGGDGR